MEDIYFSKQKRNEQKSEYNTQEFPDEITVIYIPEDEAYTEPLPPDPPAPVKKKKKHKLLKTVLSIIIAIFLVVSVLISTVAFSSGYTRTDLKSNPYVNSTQLTSSPFVTNILLLGADGEDGGSQRSDSIMLVSLDYLHGKIKLTSFLRDSWVYTPCKDAYHKLNSSYSYEGAQGVADTLEYNFGVKIDHFIKVDFEMFTQLIDRLGGIDIEVTDKEAKFITKTTRHTLESGKSVHLDGAKALVYCRIRKLDSDYMRTQRQRKVISALIGRIKNTSPLELVDIMQKVLPLLESDLNAFEVTSLAYKGGFAALLFDIQQIRIPTDDLMTTGYIGSNWVEKIDVDGCKEKLYQFIYTSYKEELKEN